MIGLFLDDERNPEDVTWIQYPDDIEWYVFSRYTDFIFAYLNLYESSDLESTIVSFDHDIQDSNLLGREVTGYDCLKFLVEFCIEKGVAIPKYYFHTMNPVGKSNMEHYHNNAKKFIIKESR